MASQESQNTQNTQYSATLRLLEQANCKLYAHERSIINRVNTKLHDIDKTPMLKDPGPFENFSELIDDLDMEPWKQTDLPSEESLLLDMVVEMEAEVQKRKEVLCKMDRKNKSKKMHLEVGQQPHDHTPYWNVQKHIQLSWLNDLSPEAIEFMSVIYERQKCKKTKTLKIMLSDTYNGCDYDMWTLGNVASYYGHQRVYGAVMPIPGYALGREMVKFDRHPKMYLDRTEVLCINPNEWSPPWEFLGWTYAQKKVYHDKYEWYVVLSLYAIIVSKFGNYLVALDNLNLLFRSITSFDLKSNGWVYSYVAFLQHQLTYSRAKEFAKALAALNFSVVSTGVCDHDIPFFPKVYKSAHEAITRKQAVQLCDAFDRHALDRRSSVSGFVKKHPGFSQYCRYISVVLGIVNNLCDRFRLKRMNSALEIRCMIKSYFSSCPNDFQGTYSAFWQDFDHMFERRLNGSPCVIPLLSQWAFEGHAFVPHSNLWKELSTYLAGKNVNKNPVSIQVIINEWHERMRNKKNKEVAKVPYIVPCPTPQIVPYEAIHPAPQIVMIETSDEFYDVAEDQPEASTSSTPTSAEKKKVWYPEEGDADKPERDWTSFVYKLTDKLLEETKVFMKKYVTSKLAGKVDELFQVIEAFKEWIAPIVGFYQTLESKLNGLCQGLLDILQIDIDLPEISLSGFILMLLAWYLWRKYDSILIRSAIVGFLAWKFSFAAKLQHAYLVLKEYWAQEDIDEGEDFQETSDWMDYLLDPENEGFYGKAAAVAIMAVTGYAATRTDRGCFAKMIAEAFRNIHFSAAGIVGAIKLFEILPGLFSKLMQYVRSKLRSNVKSEAQEAKEELEKFNKSVYEFIMFSTVLGSEKGIGNVKSCALLQKKVVDLYPTFLYLKRQVLTNMGSELKIETRLHLREAFKTYTTLYNVVYRICKFGGFRPTPFHIQLMGDPGVGKTTLLNVMSQDLRQTFYPNMSLNATVWARGDSDYFDGYANQPIAIFDEIWRVADAKQIVECLMLISNSPLPVPMAHLDDKNTFFTSEFILSTTNLAYPKVNDVLCIKAVYRRRHVLLNVTIDKRVYNPITSKFEMKLFKEVFPDYDDARMKREMPHLRFSFMKPVPEEGGGQEYEQEEVKGEVFREGEVLPEGLTHPLTNLTFQETMTKVRARRQAIIEEENAIRDNYGELLHEDVATTLRLVEDLHDKHPTAFSAMYAKVDIGDYTQHDGYVPPTEGLGEDEEEIIAQVLKVSEEAVQEMVRDIGCDIRKRPRSKFFPDEPSIIEVEVHENTSDESEEAKKARMKANIEKRQREIKEIQDATKNLDDARRKRILSDKNKEHLMNPSRAQKMNFFGDHAYTGKVLIQPGVDFKFPRGSKIYELPCTPATGTKVKPFYGWRMIVPKRFHKDRRVQNLINNPQRMQIYENLTIDFVQRLSANSDVVGEYFFDPNKFYGMMRSYNDEEHYRAMEQLFIFSSNDQEEKAALDKCLNAKNWVAVFFEFRQQVDLWYELSLEEREFALEFANRLWPRIESILSLRNDMWTFWDSIVSKLVYASYKCLLWFLQGMAVVIPAIVLVAYVYVVYKCISFIASSLSPPKVEETSRVYFKAKPPSHLVPKHQQTSMQMIEDVHNKITRNLMQIAAFGRTSNALGIDGHLLLVNLHAIFEIEHMHPDESFEIRFRLNSKAQEDWVRIAYVRDVYRFPNCDAALIWISTLPASPKIAHLFMREADLQDKELPDNVFHTYYDRNREITTFSFNSICIERNLRYCGSMTGTQVANKFFVYQARAPVGSSGGLVYAPSKFYSSPIIGIQSTVYQDKSYCAVISYEDLQLGLNHFSNRNIVHEGPAILSHHVQTSSTEELIDTPMRIIGYVGAENVVGIIGDTKFKRTIFSKEFPSKRMPAVLSAYDKRVEVGTHPLAHSVNKFGRKAMKPLNVERLKRSVIDSVRYIRRFTKKFKPRVLNIEEAIVGLRKDGYSPMNLKTSPGIPFLFERLSGCPGKKSWIRINDLGELEYLSPTVVNLVDYTINCFRNNIIPEISMYEFAKDELRPIEKVIGPPIKTRSISVLPFILSIVFRMYYLDLEAKLHTLADGTFALCVGINPVSLAWTNKFRHMEKISKTNGFDFDISNWDGHFPPDLFAAVNSIFQEMYADPQNARIRNCIIDQAQFGYVQFLDLVYQKPQGMPSGFPGTAIFNTLGHFVLSYYIWLELNDHRPDYLHLEAYLRHQCDFLYGDDREGVVSEESGITPKMIAEVYQKYGWTVTPADKQSLDFQPKEVRNCQFLKRYPKPDELLGKSLIHAAIDVSVIYDLLHWIRESSTPVQQMYVNVNEALEFSFAHGKVFYDDIFDRINCILADSGYQRYEIDYFTMRKIMLSRYFVDV